MQVFLTSLGCRLNEAELQTWAHQFNEAGFSIASKAENARLIVMNSCAVTQEAVRKSRQSVRRLKKQNPDAKLIVSGCFATLNTEEVAEMLGVDLVVTNSEKDQLSKLGLDLLGSTHSAVCEEEAHDRPPALFQLGRQRAFIKVQDGCRYRCTFCIVTIARGDEVSRPVGEIVDEVNRLVNQNVQEIVLTGVHLGGYGHDVSSSLPELIQTILDETDIPRLRMGSLEPWELNETFFGLFENPRMMPHLHLPMQSGSDTVLQRMARRCKTTDFSTMINTMRGVIANVNITTDMIAGFPGETESEWQQTLDFVEQMQFGNIHIFPYSPRQGTRAASLTNQVDPAIRKARASQLSTLSRKLKANTMQTMLGQVTPVLWEGKQSLVDENMPLVFGYTPNYVRVAIHKECSTSILGNSITRVKLICMASNNQYVLVEPDITQQPLIAEQNYY